MEFGYKKKHGFQFGQKTEPTHCGRCMRTKEEAIAEQVSIGSPCDDSQCVFSHSIRWAIQTYRSAQFCVNCGQKIVGIEDKYCFKCGCVRAI